MASRRDVLVGGGVAALGLGLVPGGLRAVAPPAAPVRPTLLVADSSIAAAVIHAARGAEVPIAQFVGDIAVPWIERLEPLWREAPQAIAGVTYGGAFFCLEQLARTRGLACTLRISPAWSGHGQLAGSGEEMVAALLRGKYAGLPTATDAPDRPLAWLLQPISPIQPRG
jgi:hypothetical protein